MLRSLVGSEMCIRDSIHTKWHFDASSPLTTIEMGRKLGRGLCALLGEGDWAPSNTVAWAETYLHAKYQLHPSSRLATINMGRKFGEGGAGSPSNTKSPGLRLSSIPSDILIHAAICRNRYGPKIGGCAPLGVGELGPHLTPCGQDRGLPACQVSS